jgi:tRNA pseudouridine13 synthase
MSIPGIEILGAARHENKLKPGHLVGNRFAIVLREVDEGSVAELSAQLAEIGRIGVPNAFGPQRFGRDGDNPERALAWLAGKERGPRDRRQQRFLFSALQSLLYNRVLERRVAAGTWAAVLPGDLAKKHDTGGLFDVPLDGPELLDARARAEAGAISATGPMFGVKMRWPSGEPAAIEREVLGGGLEMSRFEAFRHLGEGTRRALRLPVGGMAVENVPPQSSDPPGHPGRRALVAVRIVLPKGGYATTVLERACHVVDATRPGAPAQGELEQDEADDC